MRRPTGGVASVGHSFINTLQRVSETNEVAGILRRVAAVVGIPRRRRIDDRTAGDTATRPLRRPEGKRRLEASGGDGMGSHTSCTCGLSAQKEVKGWKEGCF